MASSETRNTEEREAPSLQLLPVEVLIKIFGELDIKDALHLAQTSKSMHNVSKNHSIYILGPILVREFSPFDALLRITDISPPSNLDVPFATWVNRCIYFAGTLVSSSDPKQPSSPLPPVFFKQEHLPQVMTVVKAVSKWEWAFPRLRFAELAEERRRLRPREKERLRRALYAWWRYANSYHRHHESYDVSEGWAVRPEQDQVRADSLRLLSSMQLYELQDLWKTVRAAVATQLCPSVSTLLRNDGDSISNDYLERHGWGDGAENDVIIGKVLRLAPNQLLELLDFVAVNPTASKKTIVDRIRSLHPTVNRACETLGDTPARVIRKQLRFEELEVQVARFVEDYNFPIPFGGILDDECSMEELRSALGGAWEGLWVSWVAEGYEEHWGEEAWEEEEEEEEEGHDEGS